MAKLEEVGYNSFKSRAQPVNELVKSGLVFPSTVALSDEGGVSGKDHTFSDTAIPFTTDLPIVEL